MKRRLAKFWERARSEPGLRNNLLAITALVLVGSIFAGYFLSHQRFNPPWEDRYTVNATLAEAPAVSPGNGQEVRIAGVPVGDIRDTDITEDGEAKLKLRIDDAQELHRDATVVLRPKSPLNDMYVEIDPGTPGSPLIEDGDTLAVSQSVSPVQVDDVLAHLDDNAQAALSTLLSESDIGLAHAGQNVPPGLEASRDLLTDLQPVVSQLKERRGKLARLVTALSDVSTVAGDNDERLQRLATSLSDTLATVSGRRKPLDRTLAQLPDLGKELRTTSSSVTRLAGQLDPTLNNVHRASKKLPGALNRFRESVTELDTFVDKARPVVDRAGPVAKDLRSATPPLRRVAGDLRPVTDNLRPMTEMAVPYLDDLAAFTYNTNSVASLHDANRGILRGLLAFSPESIPPGLGVLPEGDGS